MRPIRARLLRYIDEQLDGMIRYPLMWGPGIAVERQILLLLEFRSVVLRPQLETDHPRTVLDAYEAFLEERFPDSPPVPAVSRIGKDPGAERLATELGLFRLRAVAEMKAGEENEPDVASPDAAPDPAPESDLVLTLRLRPGAVVPRASELTEHYDELRRVLRALSRPPGQRGRATAATEDAIDFGLRGVEVALGNGSLGRAVMRLQQMSPQHAGVARAGIAKLADVSEWATDGRRRVGDLIHDQASRDVATQVASLALRLVPGSETQVMDFELSGRVVGGRVVHMTRSVSERLTQVVSESLKEEPIDAIGTVRAVDIDRRTIRVRFSDGTFRNNVVLGWALSREPVEQAALALTGAVPVRVVGHFYRPVGGNGTLVVNNVIPLRRRT
ncbi:MAG: hypothetical protein V4813_18265 [Gemmatimonadota bacterium]